jgi:hypothetical protein
VLRSSEDLGVYGTAAYRDKKGVGVFVRFRTPLHQASMADSKNQSLSSFDNQNRGQRKWS